MTRLLVGVIGIFVLIVGSILLSSLPQEERKARALAKKEAYARGWLFARVTGITLKSNKWTVQLERIPSELGGHASVDVVDGAVTQYRPGK